MNKRILGFVIVSTVAIAGLSARPADEKEGKIATRKENQQKRIAQGVKSGALTPKETAHLENKEVKLNNQIRQERKANGGNLTNNEKAAINSKQNKISKQIYNEKHDAQTQPK